MGVYLLAKIGADTAENERNFAQNLAVCVCVCVEYAWIESNVSLDGMSQTGFLSVK